MYITRIFLRNIRGFAELDFDLTRPDGSYAGWTVFTGDNGSGKSTLLRAVAIGLTGAETARALQPSFSGWIKDGSEKDWASIQLTITGNPDDDGMTGEGRRRGGAFPAELRLEQGSQDVAVRSIKPDGTPKTYSTPARTIWSEKATGWFSCGYGPFRRVFGASPEATRAMVSPASERFVTMFQEAASLAEVDVWLRTLSHKKLEGNRDAEEQLDLLLSILSDDLLPNQIVIDGVDSDGLWLRDRNGTRLSWEEMSDGYRAALALLTDIVRHLIKIYGLQGLTETRDGKTVIARSGVVLIDEIDAHLHPEWQREIGFWLKRHFPRMQFLVSTHSPLVCQAADPNGLFVLPEPGAPERPQALGEEDYRKVVAGRPDTILLTPAFGLRNTRSPRAVEARATRARLRAKQRTGAEWTDAEAATFRQLDMFEIEEDL
ncbi:AAA family ATPase [Imhoffiella purpurea]|uniref:ATPase n=1 Tax=Imhoffiella purpurea TaxID=1249627 RepID=W9VBV9_9GAMM|nr:ATP-binding protein [Imhoffiella purpurea]EXJ14456.1 ATPase [Imhoffiella purpurea]